MERVVTCLFVLTIVILSVQLYDLYHPASDNSTIAEGFDNGTQRRSKEQFLSEAIAQEEAVMDQILDSPELHQAIDNHIAKSPQCIRENRKLFVYRFHLYLRRKLKEYIHNNCTAMLQMPKANRQRYYYRYLAQIVDKAPSCEELLGDRATSKLKRVPFSENCGVSEEHVASESYPSHNTTVEGEVKIPTVPIGETNLPANAEAEHVPVAPPTTEQVPRAQPTAEQGPMVPPTTEQGPMAAPTPEQGSMAHPPPEQVPLVHPETEHTMRPRPESETRPHPEHNILPHPAEESIPPETVTSPVIVPETQPKPIPSAETGTTTGPNSLISGASASKSARPTQTSPESPTVTTELHFTTPPAHAPLPETPPLDTLGTKAGSNSSMCCSSVHVPGVTEEGWSFLPKEVQRHLDHARHRNKCQQQGNHPEPSPVLTQGVPLNSLHFRNTGSPYCQLKKPQCPSWRREAPSKTMFPPENTSENGDNSGVATGQHWQADIIPVSPGQAVNSSN